MKVFITQKLPGDVETFLKKNGIKFDVYQGDNIIPTSELITRAKDADALICLLTNKIDAKVIEQLTHCKVIANVAVGFNNIDVEFANTKGIVVTNTPGILDDATADLTIALILACARRIVEGDKFMREGKFKAWMPQLMLGMKLKGKIVGIIGAGRIGTEVAKRLINFKAKIIYYDKTRKPDFEKSTSAQKFSLNKLLKVSDIISIHVPFNKNTFHLLNKKNLALLKPTSILVNTSRGEVIDEKELIRILKQKKIFSAGLDVYEGEPNINPDLFDLPNVVLLPHIGSATFETRSKMAQLAVKNVIAVLKGKKPITQVN